MGASAIKIETIPIRSHAARVSLRSCTRLARRHAISPAAIKKYHTHEDGGAANAETIENQNGRGRIRENRARRIRCSLEYLTRLIKDDRRIPSRSEWPHRRYLETREMISKIQGDAASGERSDNRFLSGFDET